MRRALNLSVDEGFARRLKAFCAATGRSVSLFVESCVEPHITDADEAQRIIGAKSLADIIANEVARQLKGRLG